MINSTSALATLRSTYWSCFYRQRNKKNRGKNCSLRFSFQSGRADLNRRPLQPHCSALAGLGHAPNKRHYITSISSWQPLAGSLVDDAFLSSFDPREQGFGLAAKVVPQEPAGGKLEQGVGEHIVDRGLDA